MSRRLIDEHENRIWSTRTGNSGLFERMLCIPGECFSYQHFWLGIGQGSRTQVY